MIGQKTLPNPKPWEFVLVWNAPNQDLNNMRLAAIRFHSKQRTRTDALFGVVSTKSHSKCPLLSFNCSTSSPIDHLQHMFWNITSSLSLSTYIQVTYIHIFCIYLYYKNLHSIPTLNGIIVLQKSSCCSNGKALIKPSISESLLGRQMAQPVSRSPVVWTWMSTHA